MHEAVQRMMQDLVMDQMGMGVAMAAARTELLAVAEHSLTSG